MKIPMILITGGFVLAFTMEPALSQVSADEDAAVDAPVAGTRSPVAAALLEWLVPTAGYAYAGNWSRGLLPNAFRVGGTVLALATSIEDSAFFGDEWECSTGCQVGIAMGVVGTVWAIAGAVVETNRLNERVRAAASLANVTTLPGGGLSIGLRLRQ